MRNRYTRRKKTQRRRLLVESLEHRELLAVDGIRIDLSSNGAIDLLDLSGGGAVQTSYENQGLLLTIGTRNVPGQNNQLPVAGPDFATTGQNDPAVGFATSDLIANDSDPDSSDPLQFLGIDAENTLGNVTYDDTTGTVTYDPAGQLQFVPGGETAIDTFTYSVADSKHGIATGTVTITVSGTNDAPSFAKGADQTVLEDAGPQTIPAWATGITDGDSETQRLTFEIAANSNSALFSAGPAIDPLGNLTFTPAENEFGTAVLSVRLADDGGTEGGEDTSTTETFTITVESVNDAPSAAPPAYSATGNVPITIPAADGLLAGVTDIDTDSSAISLSSVASTTSGGGQVTGVNLTTGEFTYVSAPGFNGVDTFEFTLTDGDASTTQTATVNVADTIWFIDNSAAAGGDGTLNAPLDSFTSLNDDGNDLDSPGDVIYVATGSSPYNMTMGGVDELGFELEDDQVLIGQGAVGTSLEQWLHDEVGITVADNSLPLPPIGSDIDNSVAPVLTNTTGHVLTVADHNTISGLILDPTASAGITGSDVHGLIVEFVIIITSGGSNDNEGISLQTVSGTLTFSNLGIGSADGGTNSGTAIEIDGGTANLEFNNVDIVQHGGALLSIVNTFASTLRFDQNSELTLVGSDQAAVTIAGNDGGTVVLNNDGINVQTTATIAFRIVDNTGLQASTPVNDAPRFEISEVVLAREDAGTQVVGAFATEISPGLDPDEVAQTIAFSILSNSNPDLFDSPPQLAADGTLSYTPAADMNGTATITVVAHDDGGTDDGGVDTSSSQSFQITISPVNDAPVFDSVAEVAVDIHDGAQTIANVVTNLIAGPDNESAQSVSASITGNHHPGMFAVQPSLDSSGTLTFTPSAVGNATITVTAMDDAGSDDGGLDASSKQLTIIVTEANRAPVLDAIGNKSVDEEVELTFTATAFDINADNLTYSLTGAPAGTTISPAGQFSWTPSESQGPQDHTFDVVVTDGEFTDVETITVTVNEVNSDPVLAVIGDREINEHATLSFTATATDIDLPAKTLSFSLGSDAPIGAAITTAGEFAWTPTESQGPGTFSFDILVSDGTVIDSESITVTVNEVNDAPVLEPISDKRVVEGQILAFTVTASDVDSTNLSFSLSGNVPEGATITSEGVFSWTPTEVQGPGTFSFDVVVSDGQATDSKSMTVIVDEVNLPPVLASIGDHVIQAGRKLTFTATASDRNFGQTPTFSLIGAPSAASISQDGVFHWRPRNADAGTYTFIVEARDSFPGLTDTEEITVTVQPNDNQYGLVLAQTIDDQGYITTHAELDIHIGDARVGENTRLYVTPHLGNRVATTLNGGRADIRFYPSGESTDAFVNRMTDTWLVEIDFDGVPDNDDEAAFAFGGYYTTLSTAASFPRIPSIYRPFNGSQIDPPGRQPTLTFSSYASEYKTVEIFAGTVANPTTIFENEIPIDSTSYQTPPLPTVYAEFSAVLTAGNNYNNIANHPEDVDGKHPIAIGEYSFDLVSSTLVTFNIDAGATGQQIADVDVDIARIRSNGEYSYQIFVDALATDPRVVEATRIGRDLGRSTFAWSTEPFGSGHFESAYTSIGEIHTFTDDIEDYVIDYDGDGIVDDSFAIVVQYLPFNAFDELPENLTLVGLATDRTPLVTWDNPVGNEGGTLQILIAGDEGEQDYVFVDQPLAPGSTSVETITLPSDVDLIVRLAASKPRDDLISATLNQRSVPVSLVVSNDNDTAHRIDSITQPVPDGNVSGSYGGGASVVGGTDYVFTNIARNGNFISEFFVTNDQRQQDYLLGGNDRRDGASADFGLTSQDNFQIWQLELSDAAGDVPFEDVELKFAYDESLLDTSTLTLAEMESRLNLYRWDAAQQEWRAVPLIDRDPSGNTITVLADELSTFVLGVGDAAPVADNYTAELTVGFAEFREGVDPARQFAFVDLDLSGEDVPLNANSKIYAQLPRDTTYRPFDGWYDEDDHDLNPSTPAIRRAGFSLKVEEGDSGLAAFHASLDGTWTVLIDTDGDFDPAVANEEPSEDAKFTFAFGASNLLQLPPEPTITSPTPGSTVAGENGVTITWDVGPGSMAEVEVEVQVFNADANLFFDDLPVTGQSATTPPLPENTPFDVQLTHINRHADFAGNAAAVSGFGSITLEPTTSAFASLSAVRFTTAQDSVSQTLTVQTSVVADTIPGLPIDSQHAATASNIAICYAALTADDLQPIIDEAISRWSATGISAEQIELLRSTSIQIADLDGALLGVVQNNTIAIDTDAAGYGWYVDSSPEDDVEFDRIITGEERQATSGAAAERVDLLTTVMHELGHILGWEHESDDSHDLMSESLPVGTRRLPDVDQTDLLGDDLIRLLAGDVSEE